jgi:quercetin dioxygenase-like cupin family protein
MTDKVVLIRRTDIPAIFEIEENGRRHELGEHRDFRRHPALAEFIPERARLAMSWAYLSPNQVLEEHVHPIKSMIVVCRGRGEVLGDLCATLEEGDAVLVGPGGRHGFRGGAESGMQVLSVQFEAQGLYEDVAKPLVHFAHSPDGLERLLRYNSERLEQMASSPLFRILEDGTLQDPARRSTFIDCLHAWSRHFQTVMYARQSGCADDRYHGWFLRHLRSEVGHDELLAQSRAHGGALWDPILESTSAWFISRMSILDNCEKAAIVHLVLETTGARFHNAARRSLTGLSDIEYFRVHDEEDDAHAEWGVELLKDLDSPTYARLQVIVGQAWDVFSTMLDRMATLVLTTPATTLAQPPRLVNARRVRSD